jgi:hypothetical protein
MSEFGNSVYGLINLWRILIRNYVFDNLGTFLFVSENNTSILSHSNGAVGR